MLHVDQWDVCSTHFSTKPRVSARWLKAQREELTHMRAVQHGNQAVVENLVQYLSEEVGEQRYEDIIQENIAGIKEGHASCQEATQKALEDLERQLEGDVMETLSRMQRYEGTAGQTVSFPGAFYFPFSGFLSTGVGNHLHSTHLWLLCPLSTGLSLTDTHSMPSALTTL